ncbi:hypothetical protein M409DRAFT_58552 [Zasmidium cellare ATCC 36951]|uniref:Mid2 domain-containing protein n=1 Tax=Zasmidium cellare ATCC 36951 TaxID=1080233 RepID=A0A6A6C8Y8_ZASCE|nr:uncharacterized protein M409DRAFT_58552 [Zasmidium cellare ATCC 36951]KAF2162109.1 hypothetical protein M409DRAFT_58552 [Zasmidium cellare ATCC 36951]
MVSLLSFLFGLARHSVLLPAVAEFAQVTHLWHEESMLDQSHALHKKDLCTDAFGAGWLGSTCTPGATLLQGGCYVDLTSSACGRPGAVSCTELASGVDKACCPQYTTCAPGYNASTSFVRCNIQQSRLQVIASSTSILHGASTNSQSATEAAISANSTSLSTTTNAQASLTSTSTPVLTPAPPTSTTISQGIDRNAPQNHQTSISSGMIAGVVVAASVGVVLPVAAWVLWKTRSGRTKSTPLARSMVDATPQEPPAYNNACYDRPELYTKTPKQELAARWSRTRSPVEMPVERF